MLGFLAALTFSLTACKDECKDVNCANGGTCAEGVCTCPDGYEGELCQAELRDKIVASYSATKSCQTSITGPNTGQYIVNITKGSAGTNKVLINNFCGHTGVLAICTLNGNVLALESLTSPGYYYFNAEFTATVSSDGNTISTNSAISFLGFGSEPGSDTCSTIWNKI